MVFEQPQEVLYIETVAAASCSQPDTRSGHQASVLPHKTWLLRNHPLPAIMTIATRARMLFERVGKVGMLVLYIWGLYHSTSLSRDYEVREEHPAAGALSPPCDRYFQALSIAISRPSGPRGI